MRTAGVGSFFFGAAFVLLLGFLYWTVGATTAALLEFGYAAILLVSILLFVTHLLTVQQWVALNRMCVLINPFLVTWALGGVVRSGLIAIWGSIAPLIAAVFAPRQTVGFLAAYIVLLVVSGMLQPFLPSRVFFSEFALTLMIILNVTGAVTYFIFFVSYFANQKNVFQAQADNLLLNILPAPIAQVLRKESHAIANYHNEVSILFADIVGFTSLSAQLTPVALVELLNEVFSYFDSLVEKYGLEKIKTIGDCYMVAAGIPTPYARHAHAIVQMALDIRDYTSRHDFQGQHLNFRMGVNSGAVVAGVIGQRKFIYDLWGDAVNTASRMESHGVQNSIQITQATYELIKEEFLCVAQGVIAVKGKGEMEVWRVISANHAT